MKFRKLCLFLLILVDVIAVVSFIYYAIISIINETDLRFVGGALTYIITIVTWFIVMMFLFKSEESVKKVNVSNKYSELSPLEFEKYGIDYEEYKKMVYEKLLSERVYNENELNLNGNDRLYVVDEGEKYSFRTAPVDLERGMFLNDGKKSLRRYLFFIKPQKTSFLRKIGPDFLEQPDLKIKRRLFSSYTIYFTPSLNIAENTKCAPFITIKNRRAGSSTLRLSTLFFKNVYKIGTKLAQNQYFFAFVPLESPENQPFSH
jgi:hypothetical protein